MTMAGLGGLPPLRLDQQRQPVSAALQPGSPQVVRARFVIVSGAGGGVFVYGAGGPGTAPIYQVSGASNDPYGTPVFPGIWAGQAGGVQVGMQAAPGNNFGALYFLVPGTFAGNAAIAGIQQAGGMIVEIIGAKNTNNPDPNSDNVEIVLFDHLAWQGSGGASSAALIFYYKDASGGLDQIIGYDATGISLTAVKNMAAVAPGSGTSSTNPFQAETWHNVVLDAGWSTLGGQPAQYRLLPGGNVQLRGDIGHAGTAVQTDINSGNPLGSAYQPAATRYYRPPQAGDQAGAVQVNPSGVITMRASGFTATQALLDGIYSL